MNELINEINLFTNIFKPSNSSTPSTLHEGVVAFSIADLDVSVYGVLTMLGYFIAIVTYLLTLHFRYKVNIEPGFYFVFLAIPVIILGARFWSCAIGDAEWKYFFNLRTGGLAVQGGVVFGAIAGIIFFPLILLKRKFHKRVVIDGNVYIMKPSVWIYADAIIPTILLGQAIGRWGNFFNGEIFGAPVIDGSLDWLKVLMPGVYDGMIPQNNIISNGIQVFTKTIENGEIIYKVFGQKVSNIPVFQPLFLYESFANFMLFTLIYILLPLTRKIRLGVISGSYFLGYGIIRMITESLRDQSFKFVSTFVLNSILLVIGIILIIYCQFFSYKLREYKVWKFLFDFCKPSIRNQMKKPQKINNQIKTAWDYKFMKQYIKQGSEINYYDWR